jgi:hypothetical protein
MRYKDFNTSHGGDSVLAADKEQRGRAAEEEHWWALSMSLHTMAWA